MLTVTLRHSWRITPAQAMALQQDLAAKVCALPLKRLPRFVAAADCAYSAGDESVVAGWVVWDVERQREIESATAVRRTTFPYVPGLLSFREAPALVAAARKLRATPEVLIFDGHGRAHPRRMGIASHMGLLFDCPSIGCAKSRLCGEHKEPPAPRGSHVPLTDRGEKIGRVLRTCRGLKPVFVSVGHRVTLDDAVKVVLRCCTKHRLPEPARLAHILVTSVKNELA
ncbi:MAG TPA: deoxyribonuclease V [Phycisphaerae bacterium]|nr:deoxyribonuclease V [Phycisphaerae bacterium]